MNITQLGLTGLACISLACASKPTPVTLTGDPADRASLAGKWSGEYNSPATGRSGSIVFNLSRSGDAANGDVVMIPRGYGRALLPHANAATPAATGNHNGETIAGTFSTRGSSNTPQTGTWRVTRASR